MALLVSQAQSQQDGIPDKLPPPPEGKAWKMVWHDEFDGTKLDETKWVFRPEGKRRDGWWSPKAVRLDGQRHLVMRTYKEDGKIVDGCITTQGKFEHAFGYYVARIPWIFVARTTA